ncbi:MAG: hypothetical protein ABI286_07540 [Edaphobacter sp.]
MKILVSLALVASSLSLIAHAASPIDCAKAANPTEKTICSTPLLLQTDARMTAYFEIATQLVGMGVRGDLYDSQQAFPAVRNKCGMDKACILAAYKKQTAPLEAVIANVKTHGPF